ncbi:L-threonylcarbamoyladenylate synthase [Bacillus sp. FJAT-49736]|uniref:L-threonylcarbamoyladenylate synthase n=1 Tax=Bacillus sp. FJAT-49736 TaxID=2833582 RepID=UPI001BC95C91|nr:L-threonylcarbamoyladenylate synthase [Bacillus sp. FJAT-49736]MBS4175411.1 threonylcarbamoyl-AMP synthase [Bacillus sp. FJAT-49736]
MKTIKWNVDNNVGNLENNPQIVDAASFLKHDEVIAFPTETVYGLGANATSDAAISKVYEAKGRPSDNPLIVHIAEFSQLDQLVLDVPENARKLMENFWPGPLTIIFKARPNVLSQKVTAGLDTVGIRMPDHPLAISLIKCAGLPIAAPSANQSGKPSPTTARHVLEDLDGSIAGVLDGGETGIGVESTVVDCTEEVPVILRPGGVTKEAMEEIIGNLKLDPALHENVTSKPKAPGMKYTHYAPNAPVYLVDGTQAFIQQLINQKQNEGMTVGVIATEETEKLYNADFVLACGSRNDLLTVANKLYDTLRAFNSKNVDIIYSEIFPPSGVGFAIMNRLEKAAGHKWIYENK